MLLRQDKGRGIVIIDRNRYTNKCLNILNTEQFRNLDEDPSKSIETKIQRDVGKIKKPPVKPRIYENLSNWLSTW